MASIVTFSAGTNTSFVVVKFYDDSSGSFVEQHRFDILYGEYESIPEGASDIKIFNRNTQEILIQFPWADIRQDTAGFPTYAFSNVSGYTFINLVLGGGATGTTPIPAPNQFYYAQAGGTTVAPETAGDTLNFAAGAGLSVSANATTDTITFSNTRTTSGTAPIQTTTDLSGNTTISIDAATTSTAGSLSATDKTKLDGIQPGAQVNAVTSVNTQTGAVVLTTSNITEGTNLYFTNARADARTFAEKDQILQGMRNVDLNGDGVEFHATGPVIFGIDTSGIYATGLVLFNGLYYPSANGVAGQSITTDGTATLTMGHPYSQVTTKSATAITLALGDAGKYIRCTGATAITVTIPQNIFAVGHEILIEQTSSTAQVTIAAGTGVTLRNSGNFLLKTSEQYSIVGLKCVATNEFILTGERELA